MNTVLDVRSLTKGFTIHKLKKDIAAFENISFRLEKGQFLLLKGVNGRGKSTLLRTVYRTYVAQAGEIMFHSQHGIIDLARAADVDISYLRKTEIGFVTQFLVARPRVTAEDIVAEPLLDSGVPLDDAREEARHWLDEFGVKQELWGAYPATFSGGEQQKVNLARTLIRPRKLLMLDEPTASLDVRAREALIRRLTELKAAGTAMIGVFHHPGDVEPLINRIIDLGEGGTARPAKPEEQRL